MRLLLVSDLHYSQPAFDWVLDVAGNFDVVVMAGDHLDLASIVDRRAQAAVVKKYFSRIRTKTRLQRWSRLSAQSFRVDKWSVCRG